jgi:hypothetical protein
MIAHQTLFMHATNIPNLRFESSGHPSPDGAINILENFSEIRNTLDLTCLPENNHEAPCLPHFNEGNSSMHGFSSFFALSKTEYYELAGTILGLAITGYNKGSIDNLMSQKVIANTVLSGGFHLLSFG